MRQARIIAACGLLVMALPIYSECSADVSGKVVDESGKPIPQALVSLAESRGSAFHKATRFFTTDAGGNFHADVDLAASAQFCVLAKKEDAGYPDMRLAFYEDREPPKVLLSCGTSIRGIVVKIGPKAAFITSISVLDEKSGERIPNATITLQRPASPIPGFPVERFSISTSATLMKPDSSYPGLPLPSNVDVSYVVSAVGFKPSRPAVIHLDPLKTTTISANLEQLREGSGMGQPKPRDNGASQQH